jgi:hypothetical protein
MRLSLLLILTLATLPVSASRASFQESPGSRLGVLRGHVVIPDIGQSFDRIQAILLPPEWTLIWQGEVQQRLDSYSATYKQQIAGNPAIFPDISAAAYQEATRYVLARMQAELGSRFASWVREVSDEGRFEYLDLPFGDYNVVVVAQLGTRGMIWTERLSVDSTVPVSVEIETRIQ